MYQYIFIYLIFFFTSITQVYCQTRSDLIPNEHINTTYLEHLIKTGVDSVRHAHQCQSLINDSILFIASKHHSEYMNDKSLLSHNEDSEIFKNPQNRVIYYGGKNYFAGENILFTFYNKPIKSKLKSNRSIVLSTYGELAHSIVANWVNSPGHYKNIVNKQYSLTGVSVSINYKKRKIYATQKFAWKNNTFYFPKFPLLFPYDTYEPTPKVTSFNGIENQLTNHDHLWGLQHNNRNTIDKDIDSILDYPPGMQIKLKNNRFKLRIENSEFVKSIIQNKYDGFAIELIEFKDYMCNNSDYYIKPSKRNGQCELNGSPMQPIYRKNIYNGFKNRKRIASFKFIPYLFKKQSIPFLHRFKRFNIDKYSSKYFEIDLGEKPQLKSTIWGYNLLVIKDNKISKTYYFNSICGELYEEKFPLNFIPLDTFKSDYNFTPIHIDYTKTIPFKAKETIVKPNIFDHYINAVKNDNYLLDSLLIFCYASVEGDQNQNIKLQKTRAHNIKYLLNKKNINGINNSTITTTNWKHFNNYVTKSKCWDFINLVDHKTRLQYINVDYNKELQPILNAGRTSFVRFVQKIPFNDNTLEYYIEQENKMLIDSIYKYAEDKKKLKPFNDKLFQLYKYVHKHVVKQTLPPQYLTNFILPQMNLLPLKTKEHRVLYAYEFPQDFGLDKKNQMIWKDHIEDVYQSNTSPQYIYQKYRLKVNNLINGQSTSHFNQTQKLINSLKQFYENNPVDTLYSRIPFMVANINLYLLNNIFNDKPEGHRINALKALKQLQYFYESQNLYNENKALNMAKMAEYYHLDLQTRTFLEPFLDSPKVQAYLLLLEYQPYDLYGSFYNDLIKAADQFPNAVWCSMFLYSCKIPFQVFNKEEIRDLYCEKCQEELQEILESKTY